MIQVYSPDNTDFDKNGNMTLMPEEAYVHAVLNGEWEAVLAHPLDNEGRWKYLEEEAVVKMPSFNGEQLFRIRKARKSEDGIECAMDPVFFDARTSTYIQNLTVEEKTAQAALDSLVAACGGQFEAHSDITDTGSAEFTRVNLLEAIAGTDENSIMSRWGGEIIYDNFSASINKRAGSDRGVEMRYGKNIPQNGMAVDIDMSDIATRIYPLAYNDIPLSGSGYVDSGNIGRYAKTYIRTVTYDAVKMLEDSSAEDSEDPDITVCTTQEELDAALKAKAAEDFAGGCDKPKVTIEADMLLLQNTEQYADVADLEEVSLGDTVHCYNSRLGITTDARVIELKYDSCRKTIESVTLGDYKETYFSALSKKLEEIDTLDGRLNKVTNADGTLAAEKIRGFINGAMTQLKAMYDEAEKVDHIAILFENTDATSPTYGAMAIGTQGLMISRMRNETDDGWIWTTALTSAGLIANVVVAGILSDTTGNNYWNLDTGEFRLVPGNVTTDEDTTLKDIIDGIQESIEDVSEDLEKQIDGKIETWAQDSSPSAAWTTAEARAQHDGDLWYYTGISKITAGGASIKPSRTYKYDAAADKWIEAYSSSLFDYADGKSTIYYGTTALRPSDAETGDYLVDSTDGCTYRWSGSAWIKLTDYETAVASAKKELENSISAIQSDLQGQIDGKIETYYQASDPASSWTTAALKKAHVGDIWHDSSTNKSYRYGSSYAWQEIDGVSQALLDEIDGKRAIYYGVYRSGARTSGYPTTYVPASATVSLAPGDMLFNTITSATYIRGTSSWSAFKADDGDYFVDSYTGSTYKWASGKWVKVTDYMTAVNAAGDKEQIIYKSAAAGTASMAAYTAWVTDATGNQATWTIKRPKYSSSYPVLFIATQRITVGGTVTCTEPLIDDTTTVIDGGNIVTGTVTANQLAAGAITTEKLAASTKDALVSSSSSKTQYYLSTSGTSATGGTWYDSPNSFTWQSGRHVWTRTATTVTYLDGDSSTTYSAAVYDKQLTTALSTASSAADTASSASSSANGAIAEEQLIYRQAASGTASMAKYTTWVTRTAESVASDTAGLSTYWTTKRPTYRKNYPVLFVATQRKTVGGTVTCTTPLIDDSATVIDGGNIITGTLTANKIAAGTITASVEATNLTISGGSINVNANDGSQNYITLSGPNATGGSETVYTYISQGKVAVQVGGYYAWLQPTLISMQLEGDSISISPDAGVGINGVGIKSSGKANTGNFLQARGGLYSKYANSAYEICTKMETGAYKSKELSSAKSLATGTSTEVLSLSLDAGTWIVYAQAAFAENANGVRCANISITSGYAGNNDMRVNASASGATKLAFSKPFKLSEAKPVYLNMIQASGSALKATTDCEMRAVRIA